MRILSFILLFFCLESHAQQLTQYSQYLKNPFAINPAAAGVYDYVDIRVLGRTQWAGFTNAPMSSNVYFTMPISQQSGGSYADHRIGGAKRESEINTGELKHAVGGQLITDQYGAFRRVTFSGSYAVHVPLNKEYNLSFGSQVGLANNFFIADKAQVVYNSTTDPSYMEGITNMSTKNVLNIGTGLYLYSKTLFAGIAVDQITKNMISFGRGSTYYNPKMHFNLTAGKKIKINSEMSVTPSILWKYMNRSPLNLETSVVYSYKDWMWSSLSFRYKDAVVLGFGCNVTNHFRIAYSCDLTVSKIRSYASGSHELMIGIMLDRK